MGPYPQALSFDAAGTLFHLAEPVGRTYSRLARGHGIHLAEGLLEAGFHQAWRSAPPPHPDAAAGSEATEAHGRERDWWRSLVRETFRMAGAEVEPDDTLFEALFAHYETAEAWRLFPETLEVIEELSRRFPLAVISNFDRRFHSIAEGLGLAEFFPVIALSGEVGVSKPDPGIFEFACRRLGLAPEVVLHVGDDPVADWAGARRAGLEAFELARPERTLHDLRGAFA